MALTTFSCRQQKNLHPVPAESHAAARSLKLLAKIPKDAEATVVLVGKLRSAWFQRLLFPGPVMMLSHRFRVSSNASLVRLILCDVFLPGPPRFLIITAVQMCFRLRGVPGEARDGLRPAERSRPAGVCSGSPRTGSIYLCVAGSHADQRGLP